MIRMPTKLARRLSRLLPAFALGFAVAAGGWGFYLRHDWPDWPGGRVAEYDRREADGFAAFRRMHPPELSGRPPVADDGEATAAFDAAYIRAVSTIFSLERKQARFPKNPVALAARSFGDVVGDLDCRSRFHWRVALTWDDGRGKGNRGIMRPAPAYLIYPRDAPPPAMAVIHLNYPADLDVAEGSGRLGSARRLAGIFGFCPPLLSTTFAGIEHDAGATAHYGNDGDYATRKLRLAWASRRAQDGAGRPVFDVAADGFRGPPDVTAFQPRANGGVRHTYLSVRIGGAPRQQAAVADELRRLVVTEIVADVATAGVGGGSAGAAIFAVGSAVTRRARRRRRARTGRCVGCGYDLFGSAHSDRCPECGRAS